MRLSLLLKKAKIAFKTQVDFDVKGISSNSKEIAEDYIFVPLKGEKSDGALFIEEAVSSGAKVIIADREITTNVPVIKVDNSRETLARLSYLLYPSEDVQKLAVTGTNGKTSIAFFTQQLLEKMSCKTASIGTLGVYVNGKLEKGKMTTPDCVTLAKKLNSLNAEKCQAAVMEASSHGLDQKRLDGLKFKSAGFSNLTRDHLDYHGSMDDYFKSKLRLFESLLADDGLAVLNADEAEFDAIRSICFKRKISVFSYGYCGFDLKIEQLQALPDGQLLTLRHGKVVRDIKLNVFGSFQALNLLCAVGMASSLGYDVERLLSYLPQLKAPKGRLDLVATKNGGNIFVDYAHTPDAVKNVLMSLRPHTKGRLIVVMGCGGNRDTGKRSLMGAIANELADVVYITDDNPRFEDSSLIRKSIKDTCPKGIEIADRREAICQAVKLLKNGDTLVVCGKGHETGQLIDGVSFPFDDTAEVLMAVNTQKDKPIWDNLSIKKALGVDTIDSLAISGISIDTRTLNPGDLFIALKGEKLDGHQFVAMAVEKGASACLVDHLIDGVQKERQIVVSNTLKALHQMASYARKQSKAIFIGITGSSGKTTTKEMLKTCLETQGIVGATKGNFNNELGVPITLASLPVDAKYAIIEMGMNHQGEISKLTQMVKPDVSVITMIGTAHQEFFKSSKEIALAKAEIFDGQRAGTFAILNKNSLYYDILAEKAHEKDLKIISFGETDSADIYIKRYEISDMCKIKMSYKNQDYNYQIHFLGKHFAMNSLAVLAAVDAVNIHVFEVLDAISQTKPIAGRGLMKKVSLPTGEEITLIDDCYNANPSSMQASLNVLGSQMGGRRIAVLGQMMELGDSAAKMHADLLHFILKNKIDKVFTVGCLMKHLYDILPSSIRGKHVETVQELIRVLPSKLIENDIVLVKGSNSVGLNKIVNLFNNSAI